MATPPPISLIDAEVFLRKENVQEPIVRNAFLARYEELARLNPKGIKTAQMKKLLTLSQPPPVEDNSWIGKKFAELDSAIAELRDRLDTITEIIECTSAKRVNYLDGGHGAKDGDKTTRFVAALEGVKSNTDAVSVMGYLLDQSPMPDEARLAGGFGNIIQAVEDKVLRNMLTRMGKPPTRIQFQFDDKPAIEYAPVGDVWIINPQRLHQLITASLQTFPKACRDTAMLSALSIFTSQMFVPLVSLVPGLTQAAFQDKYVLERF